MKPDINKFKAYKYIEFDEKEQAICVVQKHRFGLILIFVLGIIISLIGLYAGIFLSISAENSVNSGLTSGSSTSLVILVAGVLFAAITLVVSAVYGYIYGNNVMLVTSDKIAQVIYSSPINRKISQLNISDVQDVTIQQTGIFSRLFNFGTLVIETAGEQQNYTFTFAANPHYCAKEIMSAREHSISKFGN